MLLYFHKPDFGLQDYTNGQLKVLVFHNSNNKVKNLTKKDLEKHDVIMISYSSLESAHRKELKGSGSSGKSVKQKSKWMCLKVTGCCQTMYAK